MKFAVVAPCVAVTLAGTKRLPLLLDNATVEPLAGAPADNVTVQDAVWAVPKVLGEHATPVNCAGANKVRVVFGAAPFALAVMVAV